MQRQLPPNRECCTGGTELNAREAHRLGTELPDQRALGAAWNESQLRTGGRQQVSRSVVEQVRGRAGRGEVWNEAVWRERSTEPRMSGSIKVMGRSVSPSRQPGRQSKSRK